jgi:hypothetical protein
MSVRLIVLSEPGVEPGTYHVRRRLTGEIGSYDWCGLVGRQLAVLIVDKGHVHSCSLSF